MLLVVVLAVYMVLLLVDGGSGDGTDGGDDFPKFEFVIKLDWTIRDHSKTT